MVDSLSNTVEMEAAKIVLQARTFLPEEGTARIRELFDAVVCNDPEAQADLPAKGVDMNAIGHP